MDRRGRGHEDGSDEKPSRTLFIRNVAYEAKEDELLAIFGKYGEIKRIFNLVDQRGMLFVTYFDSRHADAAKAELQDSLIRDRKIDIHYSLPKEDELNGKRPANDSENNKGVLFVTAVGDQQNPTPAIDSKELEDLFQSWCVFAQVKQVRDCRAPHQKFVELYDLRDSEAIFNDKQNYAFGEAQLTIQYAKQPTRDREREGDTSFRRNFSNSHYGGGSGGGYNNNGRSGFSGGGGGRGGHRGEGGRGGAMRSNFNTIRTTREAPFNSHQSNPGNNRDYGNNYNDRGMGGGGYNGNSGGMPNVPTAFPSSHVGGGINLNALSALGNLAGNLNNTGGGPNLLAQLAATIVAAGQNNNSQQSNQGGGQDVAQQLVNYLAMQRKLNDLGNNSNNSGGYNNNSGGYGNSGGGYNSGGYNSGYGNNSGGYNNSGGGYNGGY